MTKSRSCIQAYISGRVQGVWFRGFTRQHAVQANVNGWAHNLPDGRVEVMLAGETSQVELVLAKLRQGPPSAKVTEVEITRLPFRHFDSFTTG